VQRSESSPDGLPHVFSACSAEVLSDLCDRGVSQRAVIAEIPENGRRERGESNREGGVREQRDYAVSPTYS